MIIGISGKIGSGKDTVGKIIQYLIAKKLAGYNNPESEEDFNAYLKNTHYKYSTWQIKKFAGKLKECVSIITGISISDLENEEIKSKDLGDAWERWYNYHYKLTNDTNTKGKVDVYVDSAYAAEMQHLRLQEFMNGHSIKSERMTVRLLLQELGTNVGRAIHPNIWVNALMVDYKPTFNNNPWYNNKGIHDVNEEDELKHPPMYPNWIITDVRFPNEFKTIKDVGGIIIRKNNHIAYQHNKAEQMKAGIYTIHPSETALDDAKFDYIIDYHADLTDLIAVIKDILIKEKII